MFQKFHNKLRQAGAAFAVTVGSALASIQTALAVDPVPTLTPTGTPPPQSPGVGIDITVGGDGITINPGTMPSLGGNDWRSGLASGVTKYKEVAQIVLGICVITALIVLIMSIAKLGYSGLDSSPMARKKAMTSILISGIALALFGGLSLVVGFFWNFLV